MKISLLKVVISFGQVFLVVFHLEIKQKQTVNWTKFHTVDPWFFRKGHKTSSERNIPSNMFQWLIEFHCLIIFISWDFLNYLFPSLYVVNWSSCFSTWSENSGQKFKFLENQKIKNIFVIFKRLSIAIKCLTPESEPLRIKNWENALNNLLLASILDRQNQKCFLGSKVIEIYLKSPVFRY